MWCVGRRVSSGPELLGWWLASVRAEVALAGTLSLCLRGGPGRDPVAVPGQDRLLRGASPPSAGLAFFLSTVRFRWVAPGTCPVSKS